MEVGLAVLWVVLFLLLGLVALPIATWLAPDGVRAGLAIPIALATLAVVGHLVGHLSFGWPAAVAGLVVLIAGSVSAAGHVEVDWRDYGEVAVVFVLAFALIVWIRALDPAAAPLPIAIGEKFLDFGLLKTLSRTDQLPPEDMWFAGKSVRYYYGGHMLTVLLATLSDTAPRFAYNLALAGFYATLVSSVYGLAGGLAAPYEGSRRVAAGLGAFFVGIAGNFETPLRVLVSLLPDCLANWLVSLVGIEADATEWTPEDFHYFDASRVVPTNGSVADSGQAATEFPFFAWLNGDLHAHMMAQPFLVLAVGLLFAYWRLPTGQRTKRLVLLFGALPPVAGLVGFVSLWSLPTVGGLVVLTVALDPSDPSTLVPARYRERVEPVDGDWFLEEFRRVCLGLVAAVGVLAIGMVWTLPFWSLFLLGGPSRQVQYWSARTPLGPLTLVHGLFLSVFAVVLARRCGGALSRPSFMWITGAVVVGLTTLLGFPALGLIGPLVVGGWWLLREQDDVGYATLLMVAGAGIVLIVELATVDGERFNVIFKPYAQVWLLWAIAAGALLARLGAGWPADILSVDRDTLRVRGAVLATILVVSTGLYAPLALNNHNDPENHGPAVEAEGKTLDATAYLEYQYPEEAGAIRWVDDLEGQPTIVTAAPGGYFWQSDRGRGSSAPASLTGVPTMLGWFHEEQYRGEEPYEQRLGDVRDIYTTEHPDYQRDLLVYYRVDYVYVGPAERARYGVITVDELEMVTVEKEIGDVTIYRVNRSGD